MSVRRSTGRSNSSNRKNRATLRKFRKLNENPLDIEFTMDEMSSKFFDNVHIYPYTIRPTSDRNDYLLLKGAHPIGFIEAHDVDDHILKLNNRKFTHRNLMGFLNDEVPSGGRTNLDRIEDELNTTENAQRMQRQISPKKFL